MSTMFILFFAEFFLLIVFAIVSKLAKAKKDNFKWYGILKVILLIAMVALMMPLIFYFANTLLNK